MIILTATQAAQVRGITSNGAALAPVALTNGEYALPEEVLADAAHVLHHDFLDALPKRTLEESEICGELEE